MAQNVMLDERFTWCSIAIHNTFERCTLTSKLRDVASNFNPLCFGIHLFNKNSKTQLACARGVQRLVPSQMQDLRVFASRPHNTRILQSLHPYKSTFLNKHELQLDVESICF